MLPGVAVGMLTRETIVGVWDWNVENVHDNGYRVKYPKLLQWVKIILIFACMIHDLLACRHFVLRSIKMCRKCVGKICFVSPFSIPSLTTNITIISIELSQFTFLEHSYEYSPSKRLSSFNSLHPLSNLWSIQGQGRPMKTQIKQIWNFQAKNGRKRGFVPT